MSLSGSEDRWRSVVRVWNKRTQLPVGTGFIVDAGHVMTCAHVVAEALGSVGLANAPHPPDEEVEIDFPILSNSAHHLAKAVEEGWRARLPDAVTRLRGPDIPDDIAVLKFINPEKLPSDRQPVTACEEFKPGDPLVAYGIKQGLPQGTWVSATVTNYVALARVEVFAPSEEQAVQHGCSGGAAWNTARQGIAGMVVEMETGRLGRIIPIEILRSAWPQIRLRSAPGQSANDSPPLATIARQLLEDLYTFDRESQEGDFAEAIDQLWGQSGRPIVSVIAGIDDDRPYLCRDRCVRGPLHDCLEGLKLDGKPPFGRSVPWPDERGLKVAPNAALLKQQVRIVLRARDTSADGIRQAYNNGVAPCFFFSFIKRSVFDQSHHELLVQWADFWREVGSQPLNKPLAVFLLFNLNGQSPANFCLEKFFRDELLISPPDGTRALRLLNEFELQEVTDWLNQKAPQFPEEDLPRLRQIIAQSLGKQPGRLRLASLEQCLGSLQM
jgi:hypothetical protein